ncbi:CheR family methyltransferase [Mesoterricola silvestris]|uniref:protein-glutamate O-methyltransferase n=1 Tax=Mesoterricola silvestris TaxID=2927979 RepID=A0AA48GSV2_9BACT|nr:protein-glutamate O-methyltransferase CheR [Mesoterricola silvestris]BDU73382.1 chemotaxis protein methyltransferase 1 [Mesoterricola silvestris]
MAAGTIQPSDFRLMRDYIEKNCGIVLGEEKAYLVETRLAGLLMETGCMDYGELYRRACGEAGTAMRDRIVDAMTTNETLWFRDGHPFEILRDVLLPELAAPLMAGLRFRIRIWSAASSTGQEPYSIAITIHEFCRNNPGVRPEQFEILASDISPSALYLARAGRYDAAALGRGMPDDLRARYFRQDGQVWVVDDAVKRMVTLKKFNLQDPLDALGRFDIVFCRYVTIYFSDIFKRQIFEGIARLTAQGGHFFTSAVENLQASDDLFAPIYHGSGTYYRSLKT